MSGEESGEWSEDESDDESADEGSYMNFDMTAVSKVAMKDQEEDKKPEA